MNRQRNDLPLEYQGLPLKAEWKAIQKVEKGWSREMKYRVVYQDGDHLLRVRPGGSLKMHQEEFGFIDHLHKAGLAVPKPFFVGLSEDGLFSYMLLEWVKGQDLSEVLGKQSKQAQYALGLKAGRLLRGIHQSHLPQGKAMGQCAKKYENKLRKVREMGLFDSAVEQTLAFAQRHLQDLDEGLPVCQHGDYHPGNLVLGEDGGLNAIDFNRFDVGERAEEFMKLQSFTVELSVPFAIGQVHAYFEGDPLESFWRALAVHVAGSTLYSIRWARPFGPSEVEGMVQRFHQAFLDYDGFTRLIPRWYQPYTSASFDWKNETKNHY